MFETEHTNQVENDDFLEGLEMTDDFSEETEEETTADTEEEAENSSEAETEENSEDVGNTDNVEQQRQNETAAEMFPRVIRFLGEEKQITMDEAVTAVQKGLNYDRMLEKYKGQLAEVQKDPRILFVDQMAKAAGVDAGTYITMQKNQGEYQTLIDEYGDVSSIPAAVLDKFNKYSQAEIAKAKADNKAAEEQAYLDKIRAEYNEFMENHPEHDGKIPDEVADMVQKGESLEGAWARHRVTALEKELAQVKKDYEIFKANTANKNSQLPAAKGKKREDVDDFLRGFFG